MTVVHTALFQSFIDHGLEDFMSHELQGFYGLRISRRSHTLPWKS